MDRPKIRLNIRKDAAIIKEGGDTFLGKLIRKRGKLTIKTPFGKREIKRIGIAGSALAKEIEETKAREIEKPKAVVKRRKKIKKK